MKELICLVSGGSIRLDAGFNDRELTKAIEELFIVPYIYPKSNNILNGHESWTSMYLAFFMDIYFWLKEYQQRSHSAFKRVYGNVTMINYTARFV
jgi:hypothetical protein